MIYTCAAARTRARTRDADATALKKITRGSRVSLRMIDRLVSRYMISDNPTNCGLKNHKYISTHLDHSFVWHVLDPLRHYARRGANVDVGMAG